ncbi:MAG: hypothetical protein U0X92_16120 [Anaerolineales bacterium]
MNEPSANNPFLVDSLNHPLAGPIRKLLTREGRRELNQIIIDDEGKYPASPRSGDRDQIRLFFRR